MLEEQISKDDLVEYFEKNAITYVVIPNYVESTEQITPQSYVEKMINHYIIKNEFNIIQKDCFESSNDFLMNPNELIKKSPTDSLVLIGVFNDVRDEKLTKYISRRFGMTNEKNKKASVSIGCRDFLEGDLTKRINEVHLARSNGKHFESVKAIYLLPSDLKFTPNSKTSEQEPVIEQEPAKEEKKIKNKFKSIFSKLHKKGKTDDTKLTPDSKSSEQKTEVEQEQPKKEKKMKIKFKNFFSKLHKKDNAENETLNEEERVVKNSCFPKIKCR